VRRRNQGSCCPGHGTGKEQALRRSFPGCVAPEAAAPAVLPSRDTQTQGSRHRQDTLDRDGRRAPALDAPLFCSLSLFCIIIHVHHIPVYACCSSVFCSLDQSSNSTAARLTCSYILRQVSRQVLPPMPIARTKLTRLVSPVGHARLSPGVLARRCFRYSAAAFSPSEPDSAPPPPPPPWGKAFSSDGGGSCRGRIVRFRDLYIDRSGSLSFWCRPSRRPAVRGHTHSRTPVDIYSAIFLGD